MAAIDTSTEEIGQLKNNLFRSTYTCNTYCIYLLDDYN